MISATRRLTVCALGLLALLALCLVTSGRLREGARGKPESMTASITVRVVDSYGRPVSVKKGLLYSLRDQTRLPAAEALPGPELRFLNVSPGEYVLEGANEIWGSIRHEFEVGGPRSINLVVQYPALSSATIAVLNTQGSNVPGSGSVQATEENHSAVGELLSDVHVAEVSGCPVAIRPRIEIREKGRTVTLKGLGAGTFELTAQLSGQRIGERFTIPRNGMQVWLSLRSGMSTKVPATTGETMIVGTVSVAAAALAQPERIRVSVNYPDGRIVQASPRVNGSGNFRFAVPRLQEGCVAVFRAAGFRPTEIVTSREDAIADEVQWHLELEVFGLSTNLYLVTQEGFALAGAQVVVDPNAWDLDLRIADSGGRVLLNGLAEGEHSLLVEGLCLGEEPSCTETCSIRLYESKEDQTYSLKSTGWVVVGSTAAVRGVAVELTSLWTRYRTDGQWTRWREVPLSSDATSGLLRVLLGRGEIEVVGWSEAGDGVMAGRVLLRSEDVAGRNLDVALPLEGAQHKQVRIVDATGSTIDSCDCFPAECDVLPPGVWAVECDRRKDEPAYWSVRGFPSLCSSAAAVSPQGCFAVPSERLFDKAFDGLLVLYEDETAVFGEVRSARKTATIRQSQELYRRDLRNSSLDAAVRNAIQARIDEMDEYKGAGATVALEVEGNLVFKCSVSERGRYWCAIGGHVPRRLIVKTDNREVGRLDEVVPGVYQILNVE